MLNTEVQPQPARLAFASLAALQARQRSEGPARPMAPRSADNLLLTALHAAMSLEIARDRESLMSVCTLPADARVADFLRFIAESSAARGMRTDQITLRMTRAEIGNHLGLTLESVSRALSPWS